MINPIVLRPWQKEDAGQLAAIANNYNIWLNVRDRFPHPYTVRDALQWFTYNSTFTPAQSLAIVYHGSIAGSIGVLVKDDVYRKSIEVGYFVGEAFWGKGIATCAMALLLDYIHTNFNIIRVYAKVFEHNIGSMRVLEKNGFHLESIRYKSVCKNNVLMNDHVWVKFI